MPQVVVFGGMVPKKRVDGIFLSRWLGAISLISVQSRSNLDRDTFFVSSAEPCRSNFRVSKSHEQAFSRTKQRRRIRRSWRDGDGDCGYTLRNGSPCVTAEPKKKKAEKKEKHGTDSSVAMGVATVAICSRIGGADFFSFHFVT